jgi:hypothetical protein
VWPYSTRTVKKLTVQYVRRNTDSIELVPIRPSVAQICQRRHLNRSGATPLYLIRITYNIDSQDSRTPSITTSDSGAPGSSGLSSLRYIPTYTKKRLRMSYIWSHTVSNDRNEVIINDKGVSV